MKKKLPCGRFFLIDDEDEPLLAGRIWFSRKGATSFYVRGRAPGVGNPEIGLQRLILGLEDGERCSFKNLNGLDCRRSNLVRCTQAEVSMHMRKKRSYKTYKGVFWDGRVSRFYAQLALTTDGQRQRFWGGHHDNELSAALSYDELARQHHGEFAILNFPTAPTFVVET